ncbi:MAG: hypothetical protein FWF66_06715 [Candidatus Bathyarchaeota archaeon]|nr:hypothetical protein [Candidatus Termiticorpusculum sp.]MCL1971125.1 hypothetical protein [Candidatus Termiticorpusculum sp.]
MSLDSEKMKTLIAFKKRLENQLETLNNETREIQTALDIVNTMLLEKGFKRGDLKETQLQLNLPKEITLPKQETQETPPTPTTITIKPQPTPTLTVTTTTAPAAATPATIAASASLLSHNRDEVFSLKTMNDESLALICFNKEVMHVMPDESKQFNIKTPPFQNFLVERVLDKMKEKDAELVRTKQLETTRAFAYEIIKDDEGLIREIVINNVDDERLKELKSSIRWTLEKMYEKMQN